jgi:hypothetical protein
MDSSAVGHPLWLLFVSPPIASKDGLWLMFCIVYSAFNLVFGEGGHGFELQYVGLTVRAIAFGHSTLCQGANLIIMAQQKKVSWDRRWGRDWSGHVPILATAPPARNGEVRSPTWAGRAPQSVFLCFGQRSLGGPSSSDKMSLTLQKRACSEESSFRSG